VVLGDGVPLVGPKEERARDKRRGFSPRASARHSQYARVYTEFLQKLSFGDFQPQNLNCTRKSAKKLKANLSNK